jgi:hypothetical protein
MTTTDTPSELFHYTSGPGVIGIHESHQLWASSIQYLNDTTEFQFALDKVWHVLYRATLTKDQRLYPLWDFLKDEAMRLRDPTVCVFSLSELDDDLTQWRAYCPPGNGFAIGFHTQRLAAMAEVQGFRLVKCVYEEGEQTKLLRELASRVVSTFDDLTAKGTKEDVVIAEVKATYHRELQLIAPVLKHPAFRAEQEWRLVSEPKGIHDPGWRLRSGQSNLIPYYVFELGDRESASSPIAEVRVGPSPNPRVSMLGAARLMSIYRVGGKCSASAIPYRAW